MYVVYMYVCVCVCVIVHVCVCLHNNLVSHNSKTHQLTNNKHITLGYYIVFYCYKFINYNCGTLPVYRQRRGNYM